MTTGSEYVDHPSPSVWVTGINVAAIVFLLGALAMMAFQPSLGPTAYVPMGVIGVCAAIIGFYFWPLNSTYYTLSASGLFVQYGPWKHLYPYTDFAAVRWKKGLFHLRIGWPSVTPCVRLSNAVIFKRRSRWLGLYLTPDNPETFLARLSQFAPELAREGTV